MPGNITSKMSWGPNLLIKQGAKLVQEWTDVTNELPPRSAGPCQPGPNKKFYPWPAAISLPEARNRTTKSPSSSLRGSC